MAAAAAVAGTGPGAGAGPRAGRGEAVAVRLLRLEARLARAERQLRAALALRGRLQALERRLESGGGAPRVAARSGGVPRVAARPRGPVNLEGVWVQLSERERRALHRAVVRSNCHALLALEPDGPPGWDAQARSEAGNPPCAQRREDGDGGGDPAETGPEDSVIDTKREEELCAADQREGEAGEAPGEPCAAEQAFYEPEASSQAGKGQEAYGRELPGAERGDVPRDPGTGFQSDATDVLSWIKQEEEPRCPERPDLEKEEISTDPSPVQDRSAKREPLAGCFGSPACDSEFSKDPSPGVPWDSQWHSETTGTNTSGSSLGGDARYDRGFGERIGFLSAQENSAGQRPCAHDTRERSPSQQERPQAPQAAREGGKIPGPACERSPSMRVFRLPRAPAAEGVGQEPAPASCDGLPAGTEPGQNPAGGTRPRDGNGLAGEEQPSAEREESFPAEEPASPCWDQPWDTSGARSRRRQRVTPRGSPPSQPQGQGRGTAYVCSDCGKSFVCRSWLVRHRMTHTGERPYKCSQCDKTYRRKDYLLSHQRRHSGEGLLPCPRCGKRFVLRRSFLRHQESHAREARLPLAGWPCAEIGGSVLPPL